LKRAIRLRRAGIHEVYQPILAIERRVHGMVRETFFLYSFVDGVDCAHCDERLLPMVLDALRKIHRAGCRHADAKPENFLVENGRIVMIDSRFKRNILGRVGELFDFITLEDNLPAARRFNQFNRRSPAYLIPRIYRTIKLNKTVRRFKRMLRDRRARIFGAPPRETKGVA